MKRQTRLTINEEVYMEDIPAYMTLVDYLRRHAGMTGTKESCGTGDCGSCSVVMNGQVVKSCLVLAVECDGKEVTTIEGLAQDGNLHPLQTSFAEKWGTQCGYCTPGFIMAAKALLDRNPNPSDEEIKHATAGNLCRCTGYVKIIESIQDAAKTLREERDSYGNKSLANR
ncbi:(2Fe-2S)-binding protein [Ammoniphilus sp. YIM 78166]|uniref:(2Fe-2S)-binding protein n=1 Tax=Ammoniphilus sp. YIM 78166 TaxID=1644106 RepID=UPI00106F9E49|nr:(2Fe-2S)-binding protein [Ammoniphilus sp. YIM 78166]